MKAENEKLFIVGKYNEAFNLVLKEPLSNKDIYQSKGLIIHMKKHRHDNCIPYYGRICEIIENPDYIGINPNEKGISFELVKRFEDNILIGIKLDEDGDYLYVSTMHDISQSKINNRLFDGRLRDFKKLLTESEKEV